MNKTPKAVLLIGLLTFGLAACQPAAIPAASATATSVPLRNLPTPDLALPEWPLSEPAARPPALPVTASSDILYTSELLMDVYAPETAGDWPVVVLFHGAQLKTGNRELAVGIAGLGAVVFAPQWRALPPERESEISTGAENAACAVRTARARAAEYGGKADRVIVGAVSAGGTGGALVTLAGDEFHGDCLVQEGSAVADGFIGLDGGYDPFAATYPYYPYSLLMRAPADVARNDPFTYIAEGRGRDHVRFVLLVGSPSADMMNRAHTQELRDALKAAGYSVELYMVPVEHEQFAQPLPTTLEVFASLLRP